jgi:hypothetical protein
MKRFTSHSVARFNAAMGIYKHLEKSVEIIGLPEVAGINEPKCTNEARPITLAS